jgi:hypothetical protein
LPKGEVLGLPAGFFARATGFMQRVQKGMRKKRIRFGLRTNQIIPCAWLEFGQRRKDARAIILVLQD